MEVCYGWTNNHLEISDSETSETMYHLVLTLLLFMYVVAQEYIVNPAAEIKKIRKMSVRSVKLVSLSYVRHQNELDIIIFDDFLVQRK